MRQEYHIIDVEELVGRRVHPPRPVETHPLCIKTDVQLKKGARCSLRVAGLNKSSTQIAEQIAYGLIGEPA